MPTAVAALRLSRQAERIVAAAPALLTARSQAQHQEVSATVVAEVGRLERLLHQLKGGTIDASGFAAIEAAVEGLRRNLDAAPDLPEGVAARLARQVRQFAELIEGPDSILEVRAQELALVTEGERLLAENGSLSGRLTAAVDALVGAAELDIRAAGEEALAVQRFGGGVLVGVVALSLLSSILIVWRYVDRNLVARLTALSESMLAIAGGNLRAALPAGGGDEIGRMAEALAVFRDTAVEVEEKNLREVASARQRLIDARASRKVSRSTTRRTGWCCATAATGRCSTRAREPCRCPASRSRR